MSSGLGIFRRGIVLLLIVACLLTATPLRAAEEARSLRLIALIDSDDQGDKIEFPVYVFYDYWSSETYLISSVGRITVYDQSFFPIASFGKGRGVENARGLAVDRRGYIYVCMDSKQGKPHPALVIYNQAFFPVKEISFTAIPQLVDFVPDRVAVAENGEIYLAGHMADEIMGGVAVLSPDGKFLRIVQTPENNALRYKKKAAAVSEPAVVKTDGVLPNNPDGNTDLSHEGLPVELKPKASTRNRDEPSEEERSLPDYISDVKIDRQGRIYLLSRETSHVYVLNSKEEYLFKFGEKGGSDRKLSNPVSLAIDIERRVIYVCDYMRHTVICYDYDSGRYVFEFGGKGTTPLWFNYPCGIDVDQRGRVVIADLFNRRLQVLDPNMSERPALAAGPLSVGLSGSEVPAPELPGPNVESPGISVKPAPISALPLPYPLVVSSLPPPPPPLQLPSYSLPAALLPVMATPPREILPPRLKLKKNPVPLPPVPDPEVITPLKAPSRIPMPRPVRFGKGENIGKSRAVSFTDPDYLLLRFATMPAAVGVYGPVAALLGIGSRLLSRNR